MSEHPLDPEKIEDPIKEAIESMSEGHVFRSPTEEDMEEVTKLAHSLIKQWQEMTGRESWFKIVCDESNNSPEDIDNGVFNVSIYTGEPIDWIPITFVKTEENNEQQE